MEILQDDDIGLNEKLQKMKIKNEILEEKLTYSQRKAMIKEIKKKYGRDWKHILSVGKDSPAMEQFANIGRTMGDIRGK